MSILGKRAETIRFSSLAEFFTVVGYLANPQHVKKLTAEVPTNRVLRFSREFPGQRYETIQQGFTCSGNRKKYNVQYRAYLYCKSGSPYTLLNNMGEGLGDCEGRINKARFIERLVNYYGFTFGDTPNPVAIRNIIAQRHPVHLREFDYGYTL